MKMPLLFVHQTQFGYHTGNIQYCKYLKDDFDITFLCWDYSYKKVEDLNINIIYVSRVGNMFIRNIRFIQNILKCLKSTNYQLAFIHYFTGSSIIPLLCRNKYALHIDIRTGAISTNTLKRSIYNTILRFESTFYKSQSIISSGLRNKLKIRSDAYILPLGANLLEINRHCTQRLHLLYVGTLANRRIEDTIEGMKLFLTDEPNADIFYTIIGDGFQNEKQNLQNRIMQLGLQKHIAMKGYVPYHELIRFYEIVNVGVSYIPITPYFEYQPVTKTFEYLMAGMPVIATKTFENKQVVNQLNGILIEDTPESFAKGINEMYNQLYSFDENSLRESVKNYEWGQIIQNMKKTIFNSIYDHNIKSI